MLRKMGPLQGVLKLIPGMGKQLQGLDIDENELKRVEAIVLSMTPQERKLPARDQRLAPQAHRRRQRDDDPAGKQAALGQKADAEDDETDGEGQAPELSPPELTNAPRR